MRRKPSRSSWKIILPAILLSMILMRLVWMQRKDYQVRLDYRSRADIEAVYRRSPGSCAFPFARFDQGIPSSTLEDNRATFMFEASSEFRWLQSPLWQSVLKRHCHQSRLTPKSIIQAQQAWWIATITLAALTVRFLSGNWLLPLITAATLMSRGSLINEIGRISPNEVIFFFVALWLASTVHFLRTGSGMSLLASTLAGVGATLTELSLLSLLITLPVGLGLGFFIRRRLTGPIIQRFKAERKRVSQNAPAQDDANLIVLFIRKLFRLDELPSMQAEDQPEHNIERGSLLKTIQLPFALWVFQKQRWLRVVSSQLVVAFLLISVAMLTWHQFSWSTLNFNSLTTWMALEWNLLIRPVDLHFMISLLVIGACAFQSPSEGILCFFEVAWILLISVILTLMGALWLDFVDWSRLVDGSKLAADENPIRWLRAPHILVWLEPAIIGFAIAGMFHLLKIIDISLFNQSSDEIETRKS